LGERGIHFRDARGDVTALAHEDVSIRANKCRLCRAEPFPDYFPVRARLAPIA
jgi:hypothetical protein